MKKSHVRRNIFLWALYNFANTPITIAMGGLFLAQWVVLDNKFDDIWYGATFTLATIVLLLTSPFLGAWSDGVGRRMPFGVISYRIGIFALSVLMLIGTILLIKVKEKRTEPT